MVLRRCRCHRPCDLRVPLVAPHRQQQRHRTRHHPSPGDLQVACSNGRPGSFEAAASGAWSQPPGIPSRKAAHGAKLWATAVEVPGTFVPSRRVKTYLPSFEYFAAKWGEGVGPLLSGASKLSMKVLVIDIGGTHVKVASSDHLVPLKIVSGPTLTAEQMATQVLEVTAEWTYDAITIGFPGPVADDRPCAEPHNLGGGWIDFDFHKAFPKPVRFLNDAAMQALGGYSGGKMLFLGTGTGLGSALIDEGHIVPLELAHLPYKNNRTYEDYIGLAGLERRGKRRWRKSVTDIVNLLRSAFVADSVLLGGGNAKLIKKLPEATMIGANSNAIAGGIALWHQEVRREAVFPAVKDAEKRQISPAKASGAKPGKKKDRSPTRAKSTKKSA